MYLHVTFAYYVTLKLRTCAFVIHRNGVKGIQRRNSNLHAQRAGEHIHVHTYARAHTRTPTHLNYITFAAVLMVPKITMFFVECVGRFQETRNKGFVGKFYGTPAKDTLADCQQSCVLSSQYCIAVDYKEGKCGMIYKEDEFHADQLIDNVGNVHSVLKPCASR